MNIKLMKQVGFKKEIELIETGCCPFCKKIIKVDEFKDKLSKKEYSISGICQSCQDETFG